MESIHFIFNGIHSETMNQYLIKMDTGGIASPFFGGQQLQEQRIGSRLLPYHYGTIKEPITFTIEISPLDREWTPQRRYEIGKWLIHDTYKEFQTSDDLGKIYYAVVTEAAGFELFTGKGFIPFTFRTNSPYAWSRPYIDEFDLTSNTSTLYGGTKKTIIELENRSNINVNFKPVIEINLINDNSVILKNLSNGGKEFRFDEIVPMRPNEASNIILSVDNEREIIISDRNTLNPFATFNRGWLELVYGINRIEVTGKCKIRTKMQFPIIT